MTEERKVLPQAIVPALRYRDVARAIDWLCEVFEFSVLSGSKDVDDELYFAKLRFGNNTIVVGSVSDTEFDKLMVQPDQIGGSETQICSLVVDDVEAVYQHAGTVGAHILTELEDNYEGGLHFTCSDPEGHVWHVNSSQSSNVVSDDADAANQFITSHETYAPAPSPPAASYATDDSLDGPVPPLRALSKTQLGLSAAAALALFCASLVVSYRIGTDATGTLQLAGLQTELQEAIQTRDEAQKTGRDAQDRLASLASKGRAAEETLSDMRAKLEAAQQETEAATSTAEELRRALEQERAKQEKLRLSDAKANDDGVAAERELTTVRKTLEESRAAIADVRLKLNNAIQSSERLKQRKISAENELADLREKLELSRQGLEGETAHVSDLRNEIDQERALRLAVNEDMSKMSERLASLQQEQKKTTQVADTAQRKIKDEQDARRELKQQLRTAQQQHEQDRARSQKAEALAEKTIQKLQDDLGIAVRNTQNARKALAQIRSEKTQLTQRISTFDENLESARVAEATAVRAKVEIEATKKLAALKKKLKAMKLAEQNAHTALNNERDAKEQLSTRLESSQLKLANLKQQYDAALTTLSSLREELVHARATRTLVKNTPADTVSGPEHEPSGGSDRATTTAINVKPLLKDAQSVSSTKEKTVPVSDIAVAGTGSATREPTVASASSGSLSEVSGTSPPIPNRKSLLTTEGTPPPGDVAAEDVTQTAKKIEDEKKKGPSKVQVRKVQQELVRLGCLTGAADGFWSADSQTALNRFIRRSGQGLPKRMTADRAIRALRASRGKICR